MQKRQRALPWFLTVGILASLISLGSTCPESGGKKGVGLPPRDISFSQLGKKLAKQNPELKDELDYALERRPEKPGFEYVSRRVATLISAKRKWLLVELCAQSSGDYDFILFHEGKMLKSGTKERELLLKTTLEAPRFKDGKLQNRAAFSRKSFFASSVERRTDKALDAFLKRYLSGIAKPKEPSVAAWVHDCDGCDFVFYSDWKGSRVFLSGFDLAYFSPSLSPDDFLKPDKDHQAWPAYKAISDVFDLWERRLPLKGTKEKPLKKQQSATTRSRE